MTMHPCVSQCLRVKSSQGVSLEWGVFVLWQWLHNQMQPGHLYNVVAVKLSNFSNLHFSKKIFTFIIFLTKNKQRFLTPGHQGWNDLHSLCRIGMEYYLLNNDDHNIIYCIMMIIMIMMMIIIMIIMMTMMIIGTATIMIMIIIITTTLTMTIMKMIMIKTAQTPCQSLYKDRRI